MSGAWFAERKMIDQATTPEIVASYHQENAARPEHVCEVARDLFESYGSAPTGDQRLRLADVLAQVPPVELRAPTEQHWRFTSTLYRVIDIMSRARFNSTHPEWEYTNPRHGSSMFELSDARDADAVWILVGPRGGTSTFHRKGLTACHRVHNRRFWYACTGEDPNNWMLSHPRNAGRWRP